MLADLLHWLDAQLAEGHPGGRPRVTLSYAQSLDGSLAARRGQPLALSGAESRRMTHELRARHDAILVGIGTVLADDPQLTVRYASGPHPRPLVLDSHLRLPLTSRLLDRSENLPWLAAVSPLDPARRLALEAKGARVLKIASDPAGRVDLPALLDCLGSLGIRSLMVEGGAAVISAFVRRRLAGQVVITIAPLFVGGLNVLEGASPPGDGALAGLTGVTVGQFGPDAVIWGTLGEG